MATSRLGKQVVDLIDVTQIFEHAQGEADIDAIDPDVAEMERRPPAWTWCRRCTPNRRRTAASKSQSTI